MRYIKNLDLPEVIMVALFVTLWCTGLAVAAYNDGYTILGHILSAIGLTAAAIGAVAILVRLSIMVWDIVKTRRQA